MRLGSRIVALRIVGLVCLVLTSVGWGAVPAGLVWLEGEQPAQTNFKANLAGWGNVQFLSEGKWLSVSIDAEKVEKDVPAEGIVLAYLFKTPADRRYGVWNRIGFEFVRSPFEWRIDGGAWKTIRPEDLTTDLMEIAHWCEVAWIRMGEAQLTAGDHRLEIRLPRIKDDKGKLARILYASDALCLSTDPFVPHSKYKPNEDWRTPEDLKAADHVFELPGPATAEARSSVLLKGPWEITRHDEQLPLEVAAPIADLPAHPHWTAIEVPSDKMQTRPDLKFAHRLWYRTKVNVPASCAGRSFHIVFPMNNLNTTVYVNGVYCGFEKNPFARFDIDVTKAIKPGVINEVWVGIRDAYYGYSHNPKNPMKLRKTFNLPLDSHRGWSELAYPIWGAFQSGILATPEFVAAGPVKASDVFCKPSVARKELGLEVTLRNPTEKNASGEVVCEAINASTRQVEKTFAPQAFAVAGGTEATLRFAEKWENPRLWWYDDPNLYILRTTVRLNGRAVDVSDTSFGFREWTIDGKNFKLNGIVWHGWADLSGGKDKDEFLATYRKTNQRFMRLMGAAQGGTHWNGLTPEEALSFFDRNGVVVRRCGPLDGEAMGYHSGEPDAELKAASGSNIKIDLARNWLDQMVAQVKGERNHPSIMIWSLENEWMYINVINVGLADAWEPYVTKVSEAVLAVDPTRPTMIDGGGATKANTLPVHGDHYVHGEFPAYPPLAYEPNAKGGGRDRWVWDQQRPRFIGEDYFATGINPFDYAAIGGEECFVGKAQTRQAVGLFFGILSQGYRFAEYGAWHFWLDQHTGFNPYHHWSPIAVFCRQWDWTFGSGQRVARRMGIFNDTRYSDPITFTAALMVDGRQIATETREFRTAPGTHEEFDITLTIPAVTTRQEGQWVLTLTVKGKEIFRDTKAVSVLPDDLKTSKPAALSQLTQKDLLVYDPQGGTAAFLARLGIPFTKIDSIRDLPEEGRVLLIGKDALGAADVDSTRFQVYASTGRSVIVLEQQQPLRYQALPADLEPAVNTGHVGFIENLEHPIFRGLAHKDFFTWGDDGVLYRNAYGKPTRGGKSLLQCHNRLQSTAMVELPVGKGLLLVSQLAIGEKIEQSAAARLLMVNLLNYAAGYRLEHRPVIVCTKDINPNLTRELEMIKLQHQTAGDPLAALAGQAGKTVIIPASPANLKVLAANLARVNEFCQAGGYIIFHGLTPEGLADYNRIVGFDHMIRPFRRERVTFPATKNPLTTGLSTGDIVMYSGERIFGWVADEYVASDVFSYCVDYDDVAPFATSSFSAYSNITNGFVGADGWPLIIDFPAPKDEKLFEIPINLPQAQTVVEYTHVASTNYWPTTQVNLLFEGKDKAEFKLQPDNSPQTFAVDPPRTAQHLTLQIAGWNVVPGRAANVGIDNIHIKAERSPEFYRTVRPMLNVGGLMQHVKGSGGIVLCNVLFKESETVPVNAGKKRVILSTILRNLKAPFAEARSIIAGAPMRYETIDISKRANQYRDDRGWFGDKSQTFKAMPTGRQVFGGVPFQIYEFPTSPVPTVIMLGGGGVPGNLPDEVREVPVNRKADALFFLHTARIDQPMNDRERREKKFEMFRYVIRYADGKTESVPVYSEIDIHHYAQAEPKAIPGAQVAWTRPYEGKGLHAVAYSKQWNNPRPEVEITSIDMVYGQHRRGVPVLIGVTAASTDAPLPQK